MGMYEEALAKLERAGSLYPCFCSKAELAAVASAPHGLGSEGAVYPGTCRALGPERRSELGLRKRPSLRYAAGSQPVSFEDGVAGAQCFPPGAGGDFIVKRADGMISYQLAVVVDDAAMGVTDVLRGADLIDSTPRQLQLYEALGLHAPRFAHVPLMFGPDGSRLANATAVCRSPRCVRPAPGPSGSSAGWPPSAGWPTSPSRFAPTS